MSSTLTLTLVITVHMSMSAETVNQMISVERVLEYIDVEPEAPLYIPGM